MIRNKHPEEDMHDPKKQRELLQLGSHATSDRYGEPKGKIDRSSLGIKVALLLTEEEQAKYRRLVSCPRFHLFPLRTIIYKAVLS